MTLVDVAYREQVRADGKRKTFLRLARKEVEIAVRDLGRGPDVLVHDCDAAGPYALDGGTWLAPANRYGTAPSYPVFERSHDVEDVHDIVLDDDFDLAMAEFCRFVFESGRLVSGRLFLPSGRPCLAVETDARGASLTVVADCEPAPCRVLFPLQDDDGAWALAVRASRILGGEPIRRGRVEILTGSGGGVIGFPSLPEQMSTVAGNAARLGKDVASATALHRLLL